jgi:DNA primase
MPGVDFAIVRSRISLAQVLDLVGFIPLRRAGPQLRGPCPVRLCVSPDRWRFSAHLTRNQFRCFTCGAKGSQLELWAITSDQSLYDATIDLCRRLGIEVPWIRRW